MTITFESCSRTLLANTRLRPMDWSFSAREWPAVQRQTCDAAIGWRPSFATPRLTRLRQGQRSNVESFGGSRQRITGLHSDERRSAQVGGVSPIMFKRQQACERAAADIQVLTVFDNFRAHCPALSVFSWHGTVSFPVDVTRPRRNGQNPSYRLPYGKGDDSGTPTCRHCQRRTRLSRWSSAADARYRVRRRRCGGR